MAETQLGDPNMNPWYVLATIFGEQPEGSDWTASNEELAAKNRRAWNGWYCAGLSQKKRKIRAQQVNLDPSDLTPLSEKELSEISILFKKRMKNVDAANIKIPAPTEDINFTNLYFTSFLNLGGFVYERPCSFSASIFKLDADFSSAAFFGAADFKSTTFCNYSDFNSSTFNNIAEFKSTNFVGHTFFTAAKFRNWANFKSSIFSNRAFFSRTIFDGYTEFLSTTWKKAAFFNSAKFSGLTSFSFSKFQNIVDFSFTIFKEHLNFSSATFGISAIFNSAKFESATRFDDVRFLCGVPQFYATQFYDDTFFSLPDDIHKNWPPITGTIKAEGQDEPIPVMPAAEQKRAYNRLRLFMSKSLKIDEEQYFHRMEMRCKAQTQTKPYGGLFWLYEKLSDYGNSIWRPVIALAHVWGFGALLRLEQMPESWWPNLTSAPKAMGWSFANLFSFFGFQKRYFGEENLDPLLSFVSATQTILGFILLFLFGLALRNRFRIR